MCLLSEYDLQKGISNLYLLKIWKKIYDIVKSRIPRWNIIQIHLSQFRYAKLRELIISANHLRLSRQYFCVCFYNGIQHILRIFLHALYESHSGGVYFPLFTSGKMDFILRVQQIQRWQKIVCLNYIIYFIFILVLSVLYTLKAWGSVGYKEI